MTHWPLGEQQGRDFSGGPVAGTSSCNGGGAGSIPGQGARLPHASRPRNHNTEQKQR